MYLKLEQANAVLELLSNCSQAKLREMIEHIDWNQLAVIFLVRRHCTLLLASHAEVLKRMIVHEAASTAYEL